MTRSEGGERFGRLGTGLSDHEMDSRSPIGVGDRLRESDGAARRVSGVEK